MVHPGKRSSRRHVRSSRFFPLCSAAPAGLLAPAQQAAPLPRRPASQLTGENTCCEAIRWASSVPTARPLPGPGGRSGTKPGEWGERDPEDMSGSSTGSGGGEGGRPQSGSESGSEESWPSMLSHMASCREVRWPRGLTPRGWMTLCLRAEGRQVGVPLPAAPFGSPGCPRSGCQPG